MRIRIPALLTIAALALMSTGCGGSGSGGGTAAAPTAPSVPAAQPPTVNVSTPGNAGWTGQSSSGQGSGPFVLNNVSQSGSQLTGTIQAIGHSGPFAGTVSGNTLVFNFSQTGDSQGQTCGTLSGTATVSSVNTMIGNGPNTTNNMTGAFSGKDCAGNSVTNGMFAGSYANMTLSATRFPIAGTWTKFLPPTLGGGTWTWILAQDGDINGGNLTGSVTFANGNTLGLGAGTVTGTFTNTFPGPPQAVSAVTTVSFTGTCPATLTLNWAYFGQDGLQLNATSLSGSSCNAPFDQTLKPGLMRQ